MWLCEQPLIHGAGAGTTRVAAIAARTGSRSRCARFFSTHREVGQLLAQPFALTFGAGGFLFAHYYGFKLVIALLADVFKNWHIAARLKYYSIIIIGELARVNL